jgi:hypothetical protein
MTLAERAWLKKSAKRILERFPFHAVAGAMAFVGWTYGGVGVPDVARLKETASRLLSEVTDGDDVEIQTGGFSARRDSDGLHLSFSFEESEYK